MRLEIFAIWDEKVQLFAQPLSFRTSAEAVRAFADEANRAESMMHQHPEDYVLYRLGEVNCETGVLVGMKAEPLGKASQFKRQAEVFPKLAREA